MSKIEKCGSWPGVAVGPGNLLTLIDSTLGAIIASGPRLRFTTIAYGLTSISNYHILSSRQGWI